MTQSLSGWYSAFAGSTLLARGPLLDVALAVKRGVDAGETRPLMVFEDETGKTLELDLRGGADEVAARLSPAAETEVDVKRGGPGRPRLGVVSREISLLPRHWEWLNEQPGGASVALRKLVEEARRANQGRDRQRRAQEALNRFMYLIAGDFPGFEEASRAFYAQDYARLRERVEAWPADVREHVLRLLEHYLACERETATSADAPVDPQAH